MKKKTILIALILTLAGMGIFGTSRVLAQNTNGNPFSTIVEKIANKFGLKKEDVQAVFDQDRLERRTEMETKYLTQLDQLVKDGKITEVQKQLIINKHKEIQADSQSKIQSMQGKTAEERKAAMEEKRTKMEAQRKALEDWAKQNGIDPQYVIGFGIGRFGGMRGMKGGWDKPGNIQ